MDREAWWATVHRVAKSQTRLKWLSMHTCIVDLQWHVSFSCTAQWLGFIYIYMCVCVCVCVCVFLYIFFLRLFSLMGYYNILCITLVWCGRSLFFTYSIYSLYVNPKLLIYAPLLFPLVTINLYSMSEKSIVLIKFKTQGTSNIWLRGEQYYLFNQIPSSCWEVL